MVEMVSSVAVLTKKQSGEKNFEKENKPTDDADLVAACMVNVLDDDVDEIDAEDENSAKFQQGPMSQSD